MFENIIAQDAALQLRDDFNSGRLAPSMLFFGPAASGKGSAALELARALSCEKSRERDCGCPACARHGVLLHGDMLMLGKRAFQAEIAACRSSMARELASSRQGGFQAMIPFIRAIRKLTARFSPVLWEDDSKLGKLAASLQAIEEGLNDLEQIGASSNESGGDSKKSAIEKLSDSLLKNTAALENEGISATVPINQIRRASYWGRLAPQGKRKTLVIENADRMQEGARNCLLKILEEPPDLLNIVLCAQRKETIMDTLLSRLRPYRFVKRSPEQEAEVMRQFFKETRESSVSLGLGAYIDSFLPQPLEKLNALAAFFVSSLARLTLLSMDKAQSPELNSLEQRCASIAKAAGYDKFLSAGDTCNKVLAESGNFEGRTFSAFLKSCLDLVLQSLQKTERAA
jgi:DNA polymerase-3 subunit gamma/tau